MPNQTITLTRNEFANLLLAANEAGAEGLLDDWSPAARGAVTRACLKGVEAIESARLEDGITIEVP